MLIVTVLAFLVLLRWGLLLGASAVVIPRVRSCPACFADTVPIRRRWLRTLLPWLQWRWCPACGWEGPSNRGESELVPGPARRRAEHFRAGTRTDDPGDEVPELSADGWKTGS